MVDFVTVASQNGIHKNKKMCHPMVLFHNKTLAKDKNTIKSN
jgi:hypothetical protein